MTDSTPATAATGDPWSVCNKCGVRWRIDHQCAAAAGLAPFEDGWPNVPSLTVTLDGNAVLTVPLFDGERQFYDVGPYRIWVAT